MVSEKFRVRLLPPGATFKDEITIDLCPEDVKTYLKDSLLVLAPSTLNRS